MTGIPPLDLSGATQLNAADFQSATLDIQWIITTLQTVRSKNLKEIVVCSYADFPNPLGEGLRRQWQDLDHLLVELSISRSVRPTVAFIPRIYGSDLGGLAPNLLPKLTARGAIRTIRPST